jgi:hypothetical protein
MASQKEISQETNARFWISLGYKPGVALNPADSGDKRMAKAWLDIYRDLVRQNSRGTLSLTHKHPSVAQLLDRAISAYRIESTTAVGDPRFADARRAKHEALNDASLWQAMLTSSSSERITGWPW